MSAALQINVTDDVSSTLGSWMQDIAPRRVYAAIAPACKNLTVDNFKIKPPNKQGFPSTRFYADAARATRYEITDDEAFIIVDKVGIRQRLLGGTIKAGAGISSKTGEPTKYIIAYATSPESYGHNPSELTGLKFVKFGRGADAPAALVRVLGETSTNIELNTGRGFKKVRAVASNLGQVIMYWLKTQLTQDPDPTVLPSDEAYHARIDQALLALIPA